MEYIDREKLIEKLRKDPLFDLVERYGITGVIESIPAADVRPVVRGRWEYNPGDNIPYCSECMMPQDSECNFCPSCGADMRPTSIQERETVGSTG